MKNRVAKAIKDYDAKKWRGVEAAFYPNDIQDIITISKLEKYSISDSLPFDAATNALKAGFMIGYRKGLRDAARQQDNG